MTNINIEIPDKLHKKVKIQSAIDEVTIKDFIIKTLEETLETQNVSEPKNSKVFREIKKIK